MSEETLDQLRAARKDLEEKQNQLRAYQALDRSAGWAQQVEDGEETVGLLLNELLHPVEDIPGLFRKMDLIGEIRGIKKVFANANAKIEMLQHDVEELIQHIEFLSEGIEDDV